MSKKYLALYILFQKYFNNSNSFYLQKQKIVSFDISDSVYTEKNLLS